MLTVLECRKCGFVWDCEGTEYGKCSRCGGDGAVIHQNGIDYCWQCGESENACRCIYVVCPACKGTGKYRDGNMIRYIKCPRCEGIGEIKKLCKTCGGMGGGSPTLQEPDGAVRCPECGMFR